jgi:hypothetical protein
MLYCADIVAHTGASHVDHPDSVIIDHGRAHLHDQVARSLSAETRCPPSQRILVFYIKRLSQTRNNYESRPISVDLCEIPTNNLNL